MLLMHGGRTRRAGWCWEQCGSSIALMGGGLIAAKPRYTSGSWHLVTGGEPMTEGRHYWEVEMTKAHGCNIMIGAVRAGLDVMMTEGEYHNTNDAYHIYVANGGLFGNGKGQTDQQGRFAVGDRIGVLLDLGAGWMRFYRNGKRCGPGYTEGVTGPLVRAAEVGWEGGVLTVLPGAETPEGAGGADEPWAEQEPGPDTSDDEEDDGSGGVDY